MKKLIICFIFFTSLISADVTIPAGNVSGIWTQANSPYFIDGEITLQLSDQLIVRPGVDVIFNGYYKFIIHGRLIAPGTQADSILFTIADTTGFSNFNSLDGSWQGLRFMSTNYNGQPNSQLNRCRIEYCKSTDYNATYADRCGGGIYINLSSNLEITNCEISNNRAGYGGGIFIWSASPEISGCSIINNLAFSDGGGMMITGENTQPIIDNSNISLNQAVNDGNGIYICGDAVPTISNSVIYANVRIDDQNDSSCGGGISCRNADFHCENVQIHDNNSRNGGGIFCYGSSPVLEHVSIFNNSSIGEAGGVALYISNPSFSNVTINNNLTEYGDTGGVSIINSHIDFDPDNRNNIHSNICLTTSPYNFYDCGQDIFVISDSIETVIVDTFSVLYPNNFYAFPRNQINFDIWNAKIDQIYADLYVNPSGSDSNSGLTPDDPFLTINHASILIAADSLESHTIYLANGLYSPSETGEIFPIYPFDYITIEGTHQDSVVLDGELADYVLMINHIENVAINSLTLKNFTRNAIRLNNSRASIENVTIKDNEPNNYSSISSSSSTYSLNRVLCYDNQFDVWGSVIISSDDELNIINSTFYNNDIYTNSSCIEVMESNISILNSVFFNSGNIICRSMSFNPTFLNIAYCDIENGEDAVIVDFSAELNWLDGNIDADPLFVDPINGNFILLQNSPCIDAGTAYFEWNGEIILDLDENEYYGSAPDMGALEWEGTSASYELEVVSYELCNFPNPFNPSTTISFSLNTEIIDDTELVIYNLKGQKVKTFICHPEFIEGFGTSFQSPRPSSFDSTQDNKLRITSKEAVHSSSRMSRAGSCQYSVVWNGTDQNNKPVSSGIYFYKLKTRNFEKIRKMMLLK